MAQITNIRLERCLWNTATPEYLRAARERSILYRWNAPAVSKVIHPAYGEIIVPHCSNLSALMCAADVWRCDWTEIRGAEIRWVPPGAQAVPMPDMAEALDKENM